jgi:hypothetical protein
MNRTRPLIEKYSLPVIIAFTLFMYAIYWKDASIHVDERFTTILANGVELSSTKVVDRIDTSYYNHITIEDFRAQNEFASVIQNVIADGGNGLLYYAFAHSASVTIGEITGAFKAIKFLNVFFALCASILLYSLLKRKFSPQAALFASILYTALSVQFGILNRNYGMSMLFYIIYINQIISDIDTDATPGRRVTVALYASAMALPFIHFMNIPLMICTAVALILARKTLFRQATQLRHLIGSHLISALLFCVFYFGFNTEGRLFQSLVNDYWSQFASVYGTEANDWLTPFSVRYAFNENIELLLRLTGLDLRDSFPTLRISRYVWLTCIPMALTLLTCVKLYRERHARTIRIMTLSIAVCALYLGFLNILYFVADHSIPLNSQWYSSSLFVCIGLISATVYQFATRTIIKSILGILLVIVIVNSIAQGFHPVYKDTTDPCMQVVMDLTENQFR